MLVEIAGADVFCPLDFSLVGHELAGDNVHKGRLSFAVSAHKADMLAFQEAEGYVIKNGPVAEAMGQMFHI